LANAGQRLRLEGTAAEWWTASHDERNTGTYGIDTQPPAVAYDLAVKETEDGLRLSFTAPGDDCAAARPLPTTSLCDSGERLDRAGQLLRRRAAAGQPRPTPSAGGQAVTFDVPSPSPDVWFAVQSTDDAGNRRDQPARLDLLRR
jgi:hypothetical protein